MTRVSLRELEAEARRRLDPVVFDYFAGGADDELTLAANGAAFAQINLVPPVLRGAGDPDLAAELLGRRVSMPILIAPTAFHRLAHAEGEIGCGRAAVAADVIMIISMAATQPVEQIAAACAGRAWFQLYIQPDLGFTEFLVRRAEAAGCAALVVTVDSPVFAARARDLRNAFTDLPAGLCCENMRDPETGEPRPIAFSTTLSWRQIEWLRGVTRLPIVLKGVTRADDARIAVECGAQAVYVSNHGGRQLDTVPATAALLPAVADAVGGAVPVLVDGGVRRGTDVVKALAMGADAVAIGRPIVWGLTLGGADGVTGVLAMLREELSRALALCGCGSPAQAARGLIWEGA